MRRQMNAWDEDGETERGTHLGARRRGRCGEGGGGGRAAGRQDEASGWLSETEEKARRRPKWCYRT